MGERVAKSLTLYRDNCSNSTHNLASTSTQMATQQDTTAYADCKPRDSRRESFDMATLKTGSSKRQQALVKLDARRTSMEFLPARSTVFRTIGGNSLASKKSLNSNQDLSNMTNQMVTKTHVS